MKYAMIHPTLGYYTTRQPLGCKGDFVTSPEISQLFGECIGIKIAQWAKSRSSKGIHLVELGPGKGTLAADILRTLSQLSPSNFVQGCTFVEVNPHLKQQQANQVSPFNIPIRWISSIDQFENDQKQSLVFIAHEFFDALPVYAFSRNATGSWREILVDASPEGDNLNMVLSRTPTAIQRALQIEEKFTDTATSSVEVSPEMQRVAAWMKEHMLRASPSLSLIVDYGQNHTPQSSLRAIKDHRLLNSPLEDLGECDLSVDVDFKMLTETFRPELTTKLDFQGKFLLNHGIRERALALIRQNQTKTQEMLTSYERLVDPRQMGELYKVLTVENI